MRLSTFTTVLAASLVTASISHAELFKIGGFIFDPKNSARTAAIVEGPANLPDLSNNQFGKYGEDYVASPDTRINEFTKFDRSQSIACLMGRPQKGDTARHISFGEAGGLIAIPNVHRSALEVTWGESGIPNKPGPDFVVYESGSWEGFTVAVRKVNTPEYSRARYQFPDHVDKIHNANAIAFDLSDFGFADGEVAAAIRIRNIFNSKARVGPDKVDHESGEGNVVVPGEAQYKTAFTLAKSKDSKEEFKAEDLGADIVYVAGLHDVVPLKSGSAQKTAPDSQARN